MCILHLQHISIPKLNFIRNNWYVLRFDKIYSLKNRFTYSGCSKHTSEFSNNWIVNQFFNLNWLKLSKIKNLVPRDFPGGAVVKNLPYPGSSPGLGGSHMPRSGWAREPRLLSLRFWSLCPATGGAAIVKCPRTAMKSGPRTAMKSGPHLPQLEKALARTKDPAQPKMDKWMNK